MNAFQLLLYGFAMYGASVSIDHALRWTRRQRERNERTGRHRFDDVAALVRRKRQESKSAPAEFRSATARVAAHTAPTTSHHDTRAPRSEQV